METKRLHSCPDKIVQRNIQNKCLAQKYLHSMTHAIYFSDLQFEKIKRCLPKDPIHAKKYLITQMTESG
jgi:hypothetical protein